MGKINKGFAFLGCPVIINHKLPFKISEGLILKKPTKKQLIQIKNYLNEISSAVNACDAFENKILELLIEDDPEYPIYEIKKEPLDESEWKYFVVTFNNVGKFNIDEEDVGNTTINDLRCASNLSQITLRMYFVFFDIGVKASKFTEDWDYYFSNNHADDTVAKLEKSDLIDLKLIYHEFIKIKSSHPDIARSIKMFNSLPKFKGYNELFSLGLFSIIESLITHNPSGEYDSITHQIKHKIPLLERRFQNPIDYSCFGNAAPQTLWSKLYDYRSRIAHGGEIDFSGKLQILNNAFTVQLFLESLLRALLRHALQEPDLYTDLKSC